MSTDKSLPNARKIIARFGGIRPMATKLDAPVTTVQGWKKRDVIPAGRREEVLKAAKEHNIDLSDLTTVGAAASTSQPDATTPQKTAPVKTETVESTQGVHTKRQIDSEAATGKLVFVGLIAVVAFLVAGLMTMAPKVKVVSEQADRITKLEQKVDTVEKEQTQIAENVPNNLSERLANLQEQAISAAQNAQNIASQMSPTFEGATLEERLGTLENRVGTFLEQQGSIDLAGLWSNFQSLRYSDGGKQQLDTATEDLLSWINRLQSDEVTVEEALPVIREESPSIEKTFEGVQNDDLKAAAMLLAMSQMRDTLARDNESFETDLELLRKLVGSENPALLASIEKLSPHAREGVLTPDGLSEEFRGMAGEIAVASIQGEDVSIKEKAKARLNDLLKLERDGEVLTGTDSQIIVARAQNKLDEGDVQGAIALLQTLDGKSAQKAKPFMEEAELTLLATQVQELLSQSIETKLRLNMPSIPLEDVTLEGNTPEVILENIKEAVPLGGEIKEDPKSGFKIYKN